jgi:hypothetical protein
MSWLFAAHPDPSMSVRWRDDMWPPVEWYDFPDPAVGKAAELWDFDDFAADRKLATRMTQEQVLLWALLNLAGQVCNGGFSQALYNSYGQLAEEAVTGMRLFGLTRHAEIFDEAWTQFGVRPIPRERTARIERLEILADIDLATNEGRVDPSTLEGAFAIFRATSARWTELESEFFGLLHAKTHGDGYNAAFYRPLSEWIYQHRDRFFAVS